MNTRLLALVTGAMMFAAFGQVHAADDTQKTAEQCLMCHGPTFEALQEKTKDWKDEFGDPVQPHVYMDDKAAKPHQGRKILPDCVACHGQHPMPMPPKDYKFKTPSFSTCFGCHHMENFQKCSSGGCHEK